MRFKSAGIRKCRKGLHEVPANVRTCRECRKVYERSPKVKARRKSYKKKNVIGGTCSSGKHLLTKSNTKIRVNDKALMCLDCLQALARVRFKNDRGGLASGKVGDFSSRSK